MNSFQENLKNCNEILNNGGLILYPTDTLWAIGCDATNPLTVEKIYRLKGLSNKTGLVSLVANQFMLEKNVDFIPEVAYDIIDIADKPTTIIFDAPKSIAKNALSDDGTTAIRVASDKFCQYLIGKFKKPIIATTASFQNNTYPKSFDEIAPEILKGVDYVVNLHPEKMSQTPSSIIKISNTNVVSVIRE